MNQSQRIALRAGLLLSLLIALWLAGRAVTGPPEAPAPVTDQDASQTPETGVVDASSDLVDGTAMDLDQLPPDGSILPERYFPDFVDEAVKCRLRSNIDTAPSP